MILRIVLVVIVVMTDIGCLFANRPNVINFTRDTYQAANKNWSIARDNQGVVYFGNDNGLLEFDGINWQLFRLPQSRLVRSVAVDSHNRIYTGGQEEFGVWTRDETGCLAYSRLSGDIDRNLIRNNDIWRIVIDGDTIYFQSFSRVFRYCNGAVSVISPQGGVLQLMQTRYGLLAQNIHGALMRLETDSFVKLSGSEFLSETDVQFILPYKDSAVIIGTSTMGLYIYDGKCFSRWNCAFTREAIAYRLNRGIRLKSGNYMFGTILNGLYEVNLSGEVVNHFSTDNHLQNNTVLSLLDDTDGQNVWVALDRGISYISYLPDSSCHTDPQGRIGAVYTVALFAEKLFVGTNQGLYYMPAERLSSGNAFAGLTFVEGTQGQVWDLKCWNGELLCGHNSGLIVIGTDLTPRKTRLPDSGVTTITTIDHKGEEFVLLGTYRSMVVLNRKLQSVDVICKLDEPITSICAEPSGDIWLQYAQKGLYRLRFDEVHNSISYCTEFSHDKDASLPVSLQLFEVGSRVAFYGDNTFYAYDYAQNRLAPFKELNDCFSGVATVRKIVRLSDERYMALTENATYTFLTKDRKAHIVNRNMIGTTNISLVNRYENAVVFGDTLCVVCLDNGILLKDIRPSRDIEHTLPVPYLRSVTALSDDGKVRKMMPLDGRCKIQHNSNTLQFSFSAPDALVDNLSFQYRLDGVNDEWSEPLHRSSVEFGRLPRGSYLFQVRATNKLGDYSDVCEYRFTIRPPMSLSFGAFAIYIIIISLAMWWAWHILMRRYQRNLQMHIRMEEDRMLKNINRDLQQELRQKDAELLSKTSFIMQKNSMIQDIKRELDELYRGYQGNALLRQACVRITMMLNRNLNAREDWKLFLVQFEQTNSGFFKRLKQHAPDLSPSELKVAACLRLNLTSKEIASLINISTRAVENSRYMLRKKLNIPATDNLNDFFIKL